MRPRAIGYSAFPTPWRSAGVPSDQRSASQSTSVLCCFAAHALSLEVVLSHYRRLVVMRSKPSRNPLMYPRCHFAPRSGFAPAASSERTSSSCCSGSFGFVGGVRFFPASSPAVWPSRKPSSKGCVSTGGGTFSGGFRSLALMSGGGSFGGGAFFSLHPERRAASAMNARVFTASDQAGRDTTAVVQRRVLAARATLRGGCRLSRVCFR